MHHFLLLRGIIVGFLTAAPVGPAGLLCIRRTLSSGWREGFFSVSGAAIADGVFGAIAAFGLTSVPGFFSSHNLWVHVVGGAALIFVGALLVRKHAAEQIVDRRAGGSWRDVATSFAAVATNPITLPSFVVMLAATGLTDGRASILHTTTISIGIFFGSLLWWLVLSGFIDTLRDKFNPSLISGINRVTGLVLIACGVSILLGL